MIGLLLIGAIGGYLLARGLGKVIPDPAWSEIAKLKFQSPAERAQTAKRILRLQVPHALLIGPLVAITAALAWYAIASAWIFIGGF